MIVGVGVDIVEVADLAGRLERGTLKRAFSDAELAYAARCPKRRNEILAGRWAAKEAFGKAVGTGLRLDWPLNEVEVAHDDAGRPLFRFGSNVRACLPGGARVHLSISHTPTYAAAFVIICADDEPGSTREEAGG
ncbi:MAG TPA: holo-ACP synthase [Candidatus Hydrogenedentes bacterium]|nr:holo-ACP synthase [Candidatus Hydrogenedentota bacterium]